MTRFIQIKNPRSQAWIKIDKESGRIIRSDKKTPYKNIPIYEGKKNKNGDKIFKK